MAEPETLLHNILARIEAQPEKTALRAGSEGLTYAQLGARIFAAAGRLEARGIGRGDRVLLCCANHLHFPVLYFALHARGAIAVPLAPDTPAATVASVAAVCEASLAVLDKAAGELPCPIEEPAALTTPDEGGLVPKALCRGEEIADILFTTGTTGKKKGVVLTHANVLAAARNMTEFIGTTVEDVEVVPLPLSHSFGLGRLRCLAVVGHTIVLEPGVGNGAMVVKRLLDARATGLALVPAGFEILRQVTGDALGRAAAHLRYIEIGSAPMKPETRQWLMRLLPGTRICHHYGLTEASRAAFTEFHGDAARGGTAGSATPNVVITICGESGDPLPAGETGEVVVRGGMVMREYWKDPDLTHATFCSHGLRTGDIGYLDEDGYLFLLGRRSDLINVGGRKVAPDEIEECLKLMDGVLDAACVPEPDPLTGECVKAYVVSDRTIESGEVAAFLRARVEEYKIPRAVERIERIPRTNSGKVQRQLLRAGGEVPVGS